MADVCECCGDDFHVQTLQTPDCQQFDLCPTCQRFTRRLWQEFNRESPRAANRARAIGNRRNRARADGGERDAE